LTKGKYFITLHPLDRLPQFPAIIMRKQEATRLQNASQDNSKEIEMRNKRIKLIYFSLGGSQLKQFSFDWRKILIFSVTAVAGVCLLAALILGGFTKVLHNSKIIRLSKANEQLRTQLTEFDASVRQLNDKMRQIEEEEKDYLVFLEMPQINEGMRGVGTGGHALNTSWDKATTALDTDLRQEASAIHDLLVQLTKRMDLSMQMRDEIQKRFHEKDEKLKLFPSIWPVAGRRITDGFGHRTHPLTGKPDDHPGTDISSPRGADVWAAADGVVARTVVKNYTPNKGYGRFIDIAHGDEYITRYAHLSKVLVKPGDKVKRGEVIGKVGDTGGTTGPHLHYEVFQNNENKNPWDYMLD
jgi:murein DD-endopeptidase MepM/ murein hydrolase activator NlpD